MTHKLERQLRGGSVKCNGYILDNPERDPNVDILHHVYCMETRSIFCLYRDVYDEIIQQIDQKRKNDHHRIEDAAFKIGDYIVFTYTTRQRIVDFELGDNPMDLVFKYGKNVFKSQCVFNKQLNRVLSEHFGHFDLDPAEVRRFNLIPTPNVVLVCYVAWERTDDLKMIPSIHRIKRIEAEPHDFASKAEWNKHLNTACYPDDDDFVDFEEKEADIISAVPNQKGIITGLTSVFVPEKFYETILLPYHNINDFYIGHETHCDLVYNEIIKSFVVFDQRPQISTHYQTLLTRTENDVQGIFYVDVFFDDCLHGFYRHNQFKLISDPYGFLESTRMGYHGTKGGFRHMFKVPIQDRLGSVHETRNICDLNVVTRFEIVGPGDDPDQIELASYYTDKPINIGTNPSIKNPTIYGVVINAEEGRVFAYYRNDPTATKRNYQGLIFKLPINHNRYMNGDHIEFECAKQKLDPDFPRPVLYIDLNTTRYQHLDREIICEYSPKKNSFRLDALYNPVLNCYESFAFGYIPCKKPPPEDYWNPKKGSKTPNNPRRFIIEVKENQEIPSQTIFCQAEFLKTKN